MVRGAWWALVHRITKSDTTEATKYSTAHGSSIFNFLRRLHTVFHGSCTSLHPYKHCMRVLFSPCACQQLFVVFLLIAMLTGGGDTVVLICIFLVRLVMLNIFSMCLLTICMSSTEKYLNPLPIL